MPNRQQAIIWTNADLIHWGIFAALDGDRLSNWSLDSKEILLTHWPLGILNENLDMYFSQILVIDDWGISCEIALTWKPQDLADDKSDGTKP